MLMRMYIPSYLILFLQQLLVIQAFTSPFAIKCSRSSSNLAFILNAQKKGQGFQQTGGPINGGSCQLTHDEIIQIIKTRTKARRSRNFQKADEILSDLRNRGVFIDDRRKLWRADGVTFEEGDEYTKLKNSKPISEQDEAYVIQKLQERATAKVNRNYDLADDIRDELLFLMNVEIDDTEKTFRVVEPMKQEYTFGGKRIIEVPLMQNIQALVKNRADAKKSKDYALADSILEELSVRYGVRVDDSKKEWHFIAKESGEGQYGSLGRGATDARGDHRMEDRRQERNKRKRRSTPDFSVVDDSESGWSNRIPEGVEIPSGIEIPDGVEIPNGIEIPDGVEIPSGIEIPDGVEISNDADSKASPSQFESLTVPLLKEKLRDAGLPVSGRKAELIDRLLELDD